MSIKVCPNGHHYNTDDNASCPYCEQSKYNNGFDWSEVELSGETSAMGGWNRQTEPDGGWDDKTNVMSESGNNGAFNGGNLDGRTEPLEGNRRNGSMGQRYQDDIRTSAMSAGSFNWGNSVPRANDSEETQAAWAQKEYQQQPVVGWLVCIDGPDKGKDFCLHGAKSAIGRRKDSAVLLTDTKISRDGFPALIVYDDRKSHRFYLASGDASSHNNVELAGNMLLGQSLLNPYDEIRIEDTVMVFVPFCGEDFHWNGN